jgi:hypothetical protein
VRSGRPLRASPGGDLRNFRLCRVCRYLVEVSIGRRQNVFSMQRKPHGSCGSLEDPPVPGLAEDPGVPARRIMVRPDAEGSSTRGDQWRRKPLRRSGDHELRRGLEGSGTTAVEPGRRSSSFLKDAELSISYSSEFETVEHRGREAARGAATRLSLPLERAR